MADLGVRKKIGKRVEPTQRSCCRSPCPPPMTFSLYAPVILLTPGTCGSPHPEQGTLWIKAATAAIPWSLKRMATAVHQDPRSRAVETVVPLTPGHARMSASPSRSSRVAVSGRRWRCTVLSVHSARHGEYLTPVHRRSHTKDLVASSFTRPKRNTGRPPWDSRCRLRQTSRRIRG